MKDTQEVTKAVIAAAGLGSRMFPFTKVESKLLIPILNKPAIEIILEELSASGIKEVIIVSNHIHNLKQLFKDDKHLDSLLHRMKKDKLIKELKHVEYICDVDIIDQEKPLGWMHEIFHAKKYLKGGPFLVCFSDIIYYSKIPAAKQVIDFFKETKKNIKADTRFVLKPDIFDYRRDIKFEIGKDVADLEIFKILEKKGDLNYFKIDGMKFDIGDPLDYLKTQTVFGLENEEFGKDYKKFLINLLKDGQSNKDINNRS